VTKYSAMAEDTQRKSPKVTRFKGKRRRLIIGLANTEATVKPTPARSSVSKPLAKNTPDARLVTA